MKFTLKTKITVLLLALIFGQFTALAQDQNTLLSAFDQSVGLVNLGINNGTLHTNPYRTIHYTHPYYSESYIKGSVFYDGQSYSEVLLKYDIYTDGLIKKMEGESNLGINLIQKKTASFFIDNKYFVNLNYNRPELPEFIKGYYEETVFSEQLKLYIKYYKTRLEVLKDHSVLSDFEGKNDFVFSYKNAFYAIKSKKDVTAVFPEIKNKIDDYYFMNRKFGKENEIQFMKDLMAYISNFLTTTAR